MRFFTIFVTLIIYFFSFVSHNSVMALLSNQDLSNHNIVNHSFNSDSKKDSTPICSLIVDFEQDVKYSNQNILKEFVIKSTFDFIYVVFYNPLKKDSSYLKINSPPFLNKDIKNYSYIELIKVIKSNT